MASEIRPRPEAEILPWNELTEDQQRAVVEIHELFTSIAQTPWSGASQDKNRSSRQAAIARFLPHIDRERKNHVALIDGGRGSGKTVVLLWLLHFWSMSVMGDEEELKDIRKSIEAADPQQHEAADPQKNVTTKRATECLKQSIAHIVPVGRLDLEALSSSAKLGIHLVSQLQRVVEAMETEAPQRSERVAWAPGESEERTSRKAWRKFLKAAAAAWDGNLERRQAALDPEAYAIELEQAERERLLVVDCFREYVDALVGEYQDWARIDKVPLFVIAIDDADLNPDRVMEVFELIRALWHPRVVFLVAGDSVLFLQVLKTKCQSMIETGHLWAPMVLGGGSHVTLQFESKYQSDRLADDMYRKAIPPRQRYRIGLSPEQRYTKLVNVLKSIGRAPLRLDREGGLDIYFKAEPQLRAALPERMREVIDLSSYLEKIIQFEDRYRAASRFLMQLWGTALARSGLRDDQVDSLRRIVRVDEVSGAIDVEHGSVEWAGKSYDVEKISLPRMSLLIQGVSGLTATWLRRSAEPLNLSENISSVLRLAIDMVSGEGSDGLTGRVAPRTSFLVAQSVYTAQDGTRLALAWSLPEWDSFLEYQVFFDAWGRVVDAIKRKRSAGEWNSDYADRFVMSFVALVICLLERFDPDMIYDYVESVVKCDWRKLPNRLVNVVAGAGVDARRARLASQWLVSCAALMAAPEYGLAPTTSHDWLIALEGELGLVWENVRERVWGERKMRVGAAVRAQKGNVNEQSVVSLLREIDDSFVEHKWKDLMDRRPARLAQLFAEFRDALSAISLRVSSDIPSTRSLADYVVPSRASLFRSSVELLKRLRGGIERLSGIRGVAQVAVYQLWGVMLEEGTGASMAQSLLDWHVVDGRLDLRRLSSWDWRLSPKHSELYVVGASMGAVVSDVSGSWIYDREPPLFLEGSGLLSSAQDAILRVAWDAYVDELDANLAGEREHPPWRVWPGFAFGMIEYGRASDPKPDAKLREPRRAVKWPAPDWPAILDRELLCHAWNQMVSRAKELVLVDGAAWLRRIIDAMACWFMLQVSAALYERAFIVEFRMDLDSEGWTKLGRHLLYTGGLVKGTLGQIPSYSLKPQERTGARWQAYIEWWNRVPLMATPESGLSREAAGAFLKGLMHESKPDDEQPSRDMSPSTVARLRRERAAASGVPEAEISSFLRSIDEADPEHPWVEQFGIYTE